MKPKPSLNEIKKDLSGLKNFEVIIFGSYASGFFNERSDIDIAILSRKTDSKQNREIWKNSLKNFKHSFHINVFELLPLNLKAQIMDNFVVLFGDRVEISEYFYHFRRLWKDSKHRFEENQFSGYREKLAKLNAKT